MFNKLTYLILLSCGVCLTTSCDRDSRNDIEPIGRAEVSFVVAEGSRASIISDLHEFAVYGDMKLVSDNSTSPVVIFDKTEITKTDNGWEYQGTQYWFPNHEHSFIAVHPIPVLDAAQYADSKLSFSYTLPNSNDDATDIITATHRRLYREGDAASPISFQFAHLLTLINFSVELTGSSTGSEECFRIHKLEMLGFDTSATINIKPASRQTTPQTADSEIDIVTADGNGSLEISFDEPIEITNRDSAVKMFDDNNAIIMIPQTFAANDKVQILLTYSADDETETSEVSTTLSDFKWESGKSYNYRIKLELEEKEANMVINNATIAPWNLVDDPVKVDAR